MKAKHNQKLVIALATFLIGPIVSGAETAELTNQFLKAVESTRHSLHHLRVHVRVTSTTTKSTEPPNANDSPMSSTGASESGTTEFQSEYAVRDGVFLRQTGIHRQNETEFVMALNPEYAFYIAKNNGNEFYSLNLLDKSDSMDAETQTEIERHSKFANSFLGAAWTVFGTPLVELVHSKAFQIHQISEIARDGKKLVQVEFDRIENEFRPGGSLSDGILLFDPSQEWALVEYVVTQHNVRGEPFVRLRVHQNVGEVVNNIPIITSAHSIRTWLESDRVDFGTTAIEVLSTDVQEDHFFLSAYGLPEPYFETQWAGAWLVYGIAGSVCFGLAYFMQKRQSLA